MRGQGAIAERTAENLGKSGTGIVLLRQIFWRELDLMREGRPIKRWSKPDRASDMPIQVPEAAHQTVRPDEQSQRSTLEHEPMKVADAIARVLKGEGVEYLICYPKQLLIDACTKLGIKPIVCRQERVGVGIAACRRNSACRRSQCTRTIPRWCSWRALTARIAATTAARAGARFPVPRFPST